MMALQRSTGLMELTFEDISRRAARRRENLNGPIKQAMKGILKTTNWKEKVNSHGMTIAATKVTGRII